MDAKPSPTPADHAEGCLQRALRHLAAARDSARSWQLDALHRAVADELTHPAMAGADPLLDSLYLQLEGPAVEGAQPASTAGTGLTPQQWRAMAESHREGGRGWAWVAGALLAVACALMQVYPMGWAS